MAQYSPEFLAALRHRYEKTDQPMIDVAREFGIGITTLQALAGREGWEKRSQRLRGLPRAARLEREAEALAAAQPQKQEPPAPTLPLSGGGSQEALAEGGDRAVHAEAPGHTLASPPPERGRSIAERSEGNRVGVMSDRIEGQKEPPTPTLPLSGGGSPSCQDEPSPIERLERLVVQEIADLESARDLRGGKRVSGAGAERTAQALASLTRTLQTIRTMRGENAGVDDEIEDIDAFRLRLAQKIETFLESRKDDDFGAGLADAAAETEADRA